MGELQEFCAEEECYLHAEAITYDPRFRKYKLDQAFGAYVKDNGYYADHSWVVAPDGTIIDTTHGQFDRRVPILIARPGSREHKHYVSTDDMTDEERLKTYGPP